MHGNLLAQPTMVLLQHHECSRNQSAGAVDRPGHGCATLGQRGVQMPLITHSLERRHLAMPCSTAT